MKRSQVKGRAGVGPGEAAEGKDSEQWACKALHVGGKRGVTGASEALARAMAVFDEKA